MSLDLSILNSYRDFMGEDADSFIGDIIRSYLNDAPKLLDTLKETIASGDTARFVRSAHTLKSNSATLGATQLASLAAGAGTGRVKPPRCRNWPAKSLLPRRNCAES